MYKSIILSIILLFAQNLWSGNQKEIKSDNTKSVIINFDKYLKIIEKKLPELKQNRAKLDKSKNQIYRSKAIDDFRFTGGVTYSKTKQYVMGMDSLDNTKGYVFSSGLEKIISQTGTRISTSLNYSQTDITMTPNAGGMVISTYQPTAMITVTQPLLYNFFGKLDRYSGSNARMNYNINKISTMLQNRSLITYYKKLYIRWLQYERGLKILEKNITAAKKLENQVRRKARRGLADNDEVQKAHSSTLVYKLTYENYKKELGKLKDELSLYFDIKDREPDLNEFSEFYKKSLTLAFGNINFGKTTNSKLLKLNMKNLKYNLDVNKNKQLPELNFIGSATRKSKEDSYNSSFSNMNDTDYYLGLMMSYSFGNHENKGSLNDAQLSIKESKEEYIITKNSYKKNLSNLQTSKKSFLNQIKLRKQNLNSLKSQYKTERIKYNQARLNLSYLIQTENNILSANMSTLEIESLLIMLMFDYNDLVK